MTHKHHLKECPHCRSGVYMTDLKDEDDRRYWVREVRCDNCDTVMREGIGWGTYKSMVAEQAADLVGTTLAEKWNRRDTWEPEMADLSDPDRLKILDEIVSERKLLAFHKGAATNYRTKADAFSKEVFDLKTKLAQAERLYKENDSDAQIEAEEADQVNKRIETLLAKLDGE